MFDRYSTIVIIPRKTSKVIKIRIPLLLFALGFLILASLFAGLIFITFDYLSVRSNLEKLSESEQQYLQQKKLINDFSEKYENVEHDFEHLEALSYKLKAMVMASMRADKKSTLGRDSTQELIDKRKLASKGGILEVITSDASEVDSDLQYERERKFNNLVEFFKSNQNPFSKIPHGLPVKGFLIDEFGMHTDPFTGQVRPQNGIDIASRLDFVIYAPSDGIVIKIEKEENYGNVLFIDHGNNFMTKFGHISRYEVEEGEIVRKGDIIAQIGNTGRTTGPRLHYEVILNDIPQNPAKYIFN